MKWATEPLGRGLCLALALAALALAVAACGDSSSRTMQGIGKDRSAGRPADPGPPPEPYFPRPDELYIITPAWGARIQEGAPWFNIFWRIADSASRADLGHEEVIRWDHVHVQNPGSSSIRWWVYSQAETLSPRLQFGSPLLAGLSSGEVRVFGLGRSWETSESGGVRVLASYRDLVPVTIPSDPYQKLSRRWRESMERMGYPVTRGASGLSRWWVREACVSYQRYTYWSGELGHVQSPGYLRLLAVGTRATQSDVPPRAAFELAYTARAFNPESYGVARRMEHYARLYESVELGRTE